MSRRPLTLPMNLLGHLQRHATTIAPMTTAKTTAAADVRKHATSILSQKIYLLSLISDTDYVRAASSSSQHSSSSSASPSSSSSSIVPAHSSSVGEHIRHSLHHYACVCEAIAGTTTLLKYDERFRDTEEGRMRSKAMELCRRLEKVIQEADHLTKEVQVEFMSNPTSGHKYVIPSNILRELSFVGHHGVHHLASIRAIMERMGYQLSDKHIGVANSTIHHHTVRSHQ